MILSAKEAKEAKKRASDPTRRGLLSLFSLISQDREIELRDEMALHSTPTILERALQALQEYERKQTGREPGTGLHFEQPTLRPRPRHPILANPLPAEQDADASQIFRWASVRCVRRRDLWGSEKSLWRDYEAWSQRNKVSVVPRGRFAEILDQLFRREMDGWEGIALAIEVAPSGRYIM